MMESRPTINTTEENNEREKASFQQTERQSLREAVFASEVYTRLIEDFEDAFDEAELFENDDERNRFLEAFNSLSKEEKSAVLALPLEIRGRRVEYFKQKNLEPEDILTEMVRDAEKYGYTIGYHVSQKEIKPEQKNGEVEWRVKGTELDDRDDMLMAYYSLDYKNLFRKKRGDHLYVVRAQTGEETPHKRDQSNNWGRAPELSIVSKLDLNEIEEHVSRTEQKIIQQKKTAVE